MLKKLMFMPASVVAMYLAVPLAVAAQSTGGMTQLGEIAFISGGATGEVKISPDRATIRIAVQTQAGSAVAAAAANATKQTAVLSALRSTGIPNEQLSTVDYNVNPEYRYDQNKPPVVTGYSVTNTIVAEIRDLKLVGRVLDTALGAGANQISALEFYASNTDAARQQAITIAIGKARVEAETAAKAAGGTLGSLISLGIDSPPPTVRPFMARASLVSSNAPTPVNPGDQSVTSTVSARWRFLAN